VKALVKTTAGPGGLELRELPDPLPGPGQVVMAVRAAALCGTDVHIAHGTFPVRPPLVPGHELAGVVAAVGPGVDGVRVAERITTETDASVCGVCAYCRAGDQHLCPARTAIGTTADGGFAELVALPARGVHPLADTVDFASGALTEPLAVAVHAVIERAAVAAGEEVVVVGPGTIGLLAAQVARSCGANVVVAGLQRHRDRFRLARALGIERTFALDLPAERDAAARGRDGLGADVVIECSGAQDAVEAGLGLLRKGGRLVQVGFTGGERVSLDLDAIVNRELSLIASRGKRPTSFRIALELIASRQVVLEPLITHRYRLEAWEAAFAMAARPGTKVVVELDGTLGPASRSEQRSQG
jgi:L-iditol 2-dehydrogenase